MPFRNLLQSIPLDLTSSRPGISTVTNGHRKNEDSKKSLNVCLLSYRSNPYSGGQGVYVKYLSRELIKRGHSVDVVSGAPYPNLPESANLIKLPGLNLYEREELLGAFDVSMLKNPVEFFEWVSVVTGGFPEPFTFGRRVTKFLSETENTYDVIHDNQSLCYDLRILQEAGYPVVSTIHHPITVDRKHDLLEAEHFGQKLLIRRWYNFLRMQRDVAQSLDKIICVSESSKRRSIEDFQVDRERVHVVHNGIDTDLFRPLEHKSRDPNRLITTASADVPIKGVKYLLQAVTFLKEKYPDLELSVVGELNEDSDTEQLIEDLNLKDSVDFHSKISQEAMVRLYSTASVAVCPSLYEGFGLPAGEAMACGVPLVSTRGGALPEVVGSCGELVEPGNPEALARSISKFLKDSNRRREYGRKGRKRVRRLFNWEKTAKQTESIYREAIVHANH